uniref:efflux RND transporter periplasmic adaptor subunit n=1 Tax=Nevskia sp. TaxID=1929292 RepID=UPI0025E9ECDE
WLTLIGVVVLILIVIVGVKAFQIKKMMAGFAAAPEPQVAVSTLTAAFEEWQPTQSAAGSVRAVRGVTLSTEVAGLVDNVSFRSGEEVKAGERLVQLNAVSDVARLDALKADLRLAESVAKRDLEQRSADAISQAQLDQSESTLASARAAVAEQAATVAKKVISAPFSGRLGISTLNRGQYLNPGDAIVSLQQLDPIYVDFNLPQKALASLSLGQKVSAVSDSFPGVAFTGEISAIEPAIDADTRNVKVQATLNNPDKRLLPGMFANVDVTVGAKARYLTVPQTAVSFNPYGETVFLVVPRGSEKAADPNTPAALKETKRLEAEDAKIKSAQQTSQAAEVAKAEGKEATAAAPVPPAPASDAPPVMVARQVFVTVGPTRGDQVAILTGVKEGDIVVTSGQLKLKTGLKIAVNNDVQPGNNANPKPVDE